MIEENPAQAEHSESFTIIARQLKSGNFADAVRRARMKRRRFALRHLLNFAEHFGGTCKVHSALWLQLFQCGQNIVRAVDVDVHRGEAILKTLRDKALRGQMVALIKLITADYAEDAGITLQTPRVNMNPIDQMQNSSEMPLGIFERDPARDAVHFVA